MAVRQAAVFRPRLRCVRILGQGLKTLALREKAAAGDPPSGRVLHGES
jgi:hypothetical protein